MKKKTFIKNTVILTITALILRTIGLFFRIYLSNIIGAQGMGLYQLIFSVYMLASTFAISGISTAVTKLCADEMVQGTKKSVLKVLRRCIQLSVVFGAFLTLLVYFTANDIATLFIDDARATNALKILSFSLPFMGVSSCFKGYFLARRKAVTPSIASLLEQFVRIAVVVFLLSKYARYGIEKSCFAVLLADTIAEIASSIFIYLCFIRDKSKLIVTAKAKLSQSKVLREILKIAVPITAGKYLTTFLHTAENLIVPKCLSKYGGTKDEALGLFGMLKGMALPILFFPSSFLNSVSNLLIPEISESAALGHTETIKKDVSRTIHITLIASILIAGIFSICSKQLGLLLYKSEQVGFLIKVLSPIVPVMYLESVIDGILKGLNQQNSTLKYNTIDSSLRIIITLVAVPVFGINGFIAMMIFSNLLTCSLQFMRLVKVTELQVDIKNWFVKPIFAVCISIFISISFTNHIHSNISFIIVNIVIGSLVYIILIMIMKTIDFSAYINIKKR